MQLSGRRAGVVTALALVAAAVLMVAVLAKPATAGLSAATPAAGASVGAPPTEILLTFTTGLVEAHVDVSGAVTDGAPVVEGQTVRQPVRITAGGRYVVLYHVVTQDGGSLDGTLSFTVAGPGIEAAGPLPPPQLPNFHHGGSIDLLTGIVIGVNVLVVLVLAVLFGWRGRRNLRSYRGRRAATTRQ